MKTIAFCATSATNSPRPGHASVTCDKSTMSHVTPSLGHGDFTRFFTPRDSEGTVKGQGQLIPIFRSSGTAACRRRHRESCVSLLRDTGCILRNNGATFRSHQQTPQRLASHAQQSSGRANGHPRFSGQACLSRGLSQHHTRRDANAPRPLNTFAAATAP